MGREQTAATLSAPVDPSSETQPAGRTGIGPGGSIPPLEGATARELNLDRTWYHPRRRNSVSLPGRIVTVVARLGLSRRHGPPVMIHGPLGLLTRCSQGLLGAPGHDENPSDA